MYTKILAAMFDQISGRLYAREKTALQSSNPDNLIRIAQHYDRWFENFVALENYAGQIPQTKEHIFGVFNGATPAEGRAFLYEMQTILRENKQLLKAAMLFHDVGKYTKNADHSILSYEKYQAIRQDNFQALADTEIFTILQQFDEETRNILGLLIRYHDLGSISMDGNWGGIVQLQQDYAAQIKQQPIEKFIQQLICLIALDKASIAAFGLRGVLGYFDIQRCRSILEKSLVQNKTIETLDDWADVVTCQFIFYYTDRQKAYDFYFPRIQALTQKYFAGQAESFLAQLRQSMAQALTFNYINDYLLDFALEKDVRPFMKEQRQDILFDDPSSLLRFFMCKTAIVFFFAQEKAALGRTFPYDFPASKDIFAVKTAAEIYTAILRYLNEGVATPILKI